MLDIHLVRRHYRRKECLMNEMLRRRNLFLIPKNMKKIVDFTLTEENYSEHTVVIMSQNSIFLDGFTLDKEWIIRIDVAKDAEWTTSSRPTLYLFDRINAPWNEILRNMQPGVGTGDTKCVMWARGICVEDGYYYNGAFYNSQSHMADAPTKNFAGYQEKGVINQLRLTFGTTWTPTVGTRIRIYSN